MLHRVVGISLLIVIIGALNACGGSDSGSPDTFPAHVSPSSAPPLTCGPIGQATVDVMKDLNYFWQSSAVACSCQFDAPTCQGNAMVLDNGYGYIYFDANLLDSTYFSTGSRLPSDMVVAHEFGHNIQLALNLPASLNKFRELQADCLAGFYVGSRVKRQLVNQYDLVQAFGAACGFGDSASTPWWGQDAHGTCSERVAAVQAGIQGFLSGLLPGQACPSA